MMSAMDCRPCGKTLQLVVWPIYHDTIVTCHAAPDHPEQHRAATTGILPDGTVVEVTALWSEPDKESQ